jgi:hypothetical protein
MPIIADDVMSRFPKCHRARFVADKARCWCSCQFSCHQRPFIEDETCISDAAKIRPSVLLARWSTSFITLAFFSDVPVVAAAWAP